MRTIIAALARLVAKSRSNRAKAFGTWNSTKIDSTSYVRELREEWD